jgi:hypothetical protein
MFVKVNDSSFIRDTASMALINTDNRERTDYESKMRMARVQKEEINNLKSEINDVRDDVKEIKQMLTQLIGKNLNG